MAAMVKTTSQLFRMLSLCASPLSSSKLLLATFRADTFIFTLKHPKSPSTQSLHTPP